MDCFTTGSNILALALTFFLVANPIGNTPAIIALIKDFSFERQKKIMLRESILALLLALFFQFFGEVFLGALKVHDYAVTFSGGILLFLVALNMIFVTKEEGRHVAAKQEPFFVPIATPIISGPGLLAIIMLYSKQEANNLKISTAIILAWIGVFAVLNSAPYIQKLLGKRALIALEQLMGMVLALLAMQMIVKGAILFVKTL